MAVIEAIATTYLEADASSVTFSSIPTTYEHLQLRASMLLIDSASKASCIVRFNGDSSSSNYANHQMRGYTSTSAGMANTSNTLYYFPATGDGTNRATYNGFIMDILDYANTNKNTTALTLRGHNTGGDDYPNLMDFGSILWDNTAAVTEIGLFNDATNWARGTEVTLYGLNSS